MNYGTLETSPLNLPTHDNAARDSSVYRPYLSIPVVGLQDGVAAGHVLRPRVFKDRRQRYRVNRVNDF